MGKKRATNKHLPRRMYKNGRSYYYVTRQNEWINLGREYPLALSQWAKIEGSGENNGFFSGAIDRYTIEILPTLAPKTQADRVPILKKLRETFGSAPLDQVKTIHLRRYLDQRTAKVAANREIAALSTIYNHAINWGWTERNPCVGLKKNKEKRRDRYITDQELETLKAKAYPTYRAIIDLAYLTGMRRGDIIDLRLVDITDKGIFVRQNKTGHRQRFTWSPTLRAVIKAAKKARKTRNIEFLFTSRHGSQITPTAFNSAWRRLREKANLLDINFHDIRGKAITDAKEKAGIDYAQAFGGHENQSQTEGYVRSKTIADVHPLK